MFQYKKEKSERSEIYVLMVALNFVVSVATGVGFGDVTAHNIAELLLVCEPRTILSSFKKDKIY